MQNLLLRGSRPPPNCTGRVCFISLIFLFCARALTSLSQFFFFQTTDSDRDIRAEREREMGIHIL